MVKTLWLNDIVIDDFDLKATIRDRRQMLDKLPQFRSAYSICTVDRDWPIEFPSACRNLECSSYFLVISFLRRFTILIRCTFGV